MAGAAARADRLRRFAVSVLFRVCRQSAADQPRTAGRRTGCSPRLMSAPRTRFHPGNVDFPAVIAHRQALWPRVLERFDAAARPAMRDRFDRFRLAQADWLDDFALFMAVKDAHGRRLDGVGARHRASRIRRHRAWSARCAREIRQHQLTQFLFFEQWQRVRDACRARSIRIMGDLPIFVAHDSADVWANRELFRLDADGQPTVRGRRAAGLLQRDRPTVGQSRTTAGTCSHGPATPGGSSAFARCWSWSIASASITSAASKRHGRCRGDATDRRQRAVGEGTGRSALRGRAVGVSSSSCRSSPKIWA